MYCNPTLTSQEFSDVHNALYYLRNLTSEVKCQNQSTELNKIIGLLEQGLKGAYQQDTAACERKNAHYDSMAEIHKLSTHWSLNEVEDLTSAHSFAGATELIYVNHWGTKPITVAIAGSTWIDLWLAAEAAIVLSGDHHHIFVEGFKFNHCGQLELATGS